MDKAIARLQDDLADLATSKALDVKFRIVTHQVHEDSPALQQALHQAAKRELISLDNPEFQDLRLKISPEDAQEYLRRVPGDKEMYAQLASKFLTYYREN